MKKLVCAGLMIAGLFVNKSFAQEKGNQQGKEEGSKQEAQLPPGSWIVIEPRQYTIDQSCRVMSTADGVTWDQSPTNSWMDLDGSWYHLEEKQIFRSMDGNTWEPVKDNRWQDVLGNQFMLTESCSVVTGNDEGLSMQKKDAKPETVQVSKENIAQERKDYESRINKRITELEGEVKQLKKDAKKDPDKKVEMEEREVRIAKLRQGLAVMGKQADDEWDDLKKEIDKLF
jgi:predicted small secreted protein